MLGYKKLFVAITMINIAMVAQTKVTLEMHDYTPSMFQERNLRSMRLKQALVIVLESLQAQ